MSEINYALVEEKRPPIYTAMKYWGKKPHNIWRKYIENYTPNDGVVLDPFAGSCMSAFEAVKAGKKAIAFDINPLSSFIIEVFAAKYKEEQFKSKVEGILKIVSEDDNYKRFYKTACPKCGGKAVAQNFKWDSGRIYEVGVFCERHNGGKIERSLKEPDKADIELAEESGKLEIPYWYPNKEFPRSPSFSASFVRNIGGSSFDKLWTRRNLYVLSLIFNEIEKVDDNELRMHLLFGFTQAIHLCTKMSVPRRENARRPFSTSWGRSAYICSARQMEMNPLLVFKSSCLGRQSVESALKGVEGYLGKLPRVLYVDRSNRSQETRSYDIKYGVIDVTILDDYIKENSVDFIITDPPYGGLVQYLDLSLIWLVWLERIDSKYWPNLDAEITIKRGSVNIDSYQMKFTNAMKKLHKVLKDDGKLVLTFHNKEVDIWNAFLNSVVLAGFKIEKVIHQQNRRTGESNVANPYGTSGADFYIRCVKSLDVRFETDKDEFEHYVLTKAIQLIALRNEPTPYQILFNGLLVEISKAGFDLQDFDKNIEKILSQHVGTIFKITNNSADKSGNFWWFTEPDKYIKYPDRSLADRVEESVIALLRRKISVSLDDVLAEIFIKYPNGLTPTKKSVTSILAKYAHRSNDKWVYRGGEIEKSFTQHTHIIYLLSIVGKKIGSKVFIGKREQPEPYKGGRLGDHADYLKLPKLFNNDIVSRLEMIDMLWLNDNNVACALEVENSTNFTSGIQRASNLGSDVPKIMVVPDSRVTELNGVNDKLFVDSFKKYNWKYITYTDVERLSSLRVISYEDVKGVSKDIKDGR